MKNNTRESKMYLKKVVGEHEGLYYLHPVAVRVARRKKISREEM